LLDSWEIAAESVQTHLVYRHTDTQTHTYIDTHIHRHT